MVDLRVMCFIQLSTGELSGYSDQLKNFIDHIVT